MEKVDHENLKLSPTSAMIQTIASLSPHQPIYITINYILIHNKNVYNSMGIVCICMSSLTAQTLLHLLIRSSWWSRCFWHPTHQYSYDLQLNSAICLNIAEQEKYIYLRLWSDIKDSSLCNSPVFRQHTQRSLMFWLRVERVKAVAMKQSQTCENTLKMNLWTFTSFPCEF